MHERAKGKGEKPSLFIPLIKEYFLGRGILLKAPLSKMAAPRVNPVCPNINM